MKVHELATRCVYRLRPIDYIDTAIALMEAHGFHHLPVVGPDDEVVGMVSDRDILLSVGWHRSSERFLKEGLDGVAGPVRVEQIMSARVVSLSPNEPIQRAAALLVEHKIGALPIVRQGRLVGLISETDLLESLRDGRIDADGLCQRRVRDLMHAPVRTVHPQSSLSEVVRAFREEHIRHLPVVVRGPKREDILIGIVSDRDVRRALGESAVSDERAQQRGEFYIGPTRVMDAMTSGARTVGPDQTVAEAVDIMLCNRIRALPVLQGQALVGIFTETDIACAIALAPAHDLKEAGTESVHAGRAC